MRLLDTKTHKGNGTCCSARTVNKHGFLLFTLLICFLVSGCTAIQEVINGPRHSKAVNPKKTSHTDLSSTEQMSPIKGRVISPFGYRGGHNHTGSDIKLQRGDTVRAAFSGVVTKASPYSGYGNLVILKHANNIETYYAHLSKCLVQTGDSVAVGEIVGLGGRTGRATTDHLHFEVRFNHVPKNPENFFDFSNGTTKILFLAYAPSIKIKKEPVIQIRNEQIAEVNTSNDFVVIQKGDTFFAIAKQYGTTVKQLQELNKMQSSNLKIGTKLRIK